VRIEFKSDSKPCEKLDIKFESKSESTFMAIGLESKPCEKLDIKFDSELPKTRLKRKVGRSPF